VHLQAAGHPILGDALYAPAAEQELSPRLLLHASSLDLEHPLSGVPLHFNCPAEF
jgi:tRNA pseudouridine32 synthase/23S rRNA pseudouridine746 synthase